MSRQQRAVKQPTLTPSPPHLVSQSPPQGLMLAWLVALFAARWLMPTEGAAEGLTLWLVQLVLFTAVARAAWEWRFGEQRFRFDAMDGAIGLLIMAQVVSALTVVFGVGNARAAINVAWEWVGSGVLIWMLRQELTSLRVVRQLCLGLSLTAGVLAGFGLWQHYVGYDEMSREYDRLVAEHDRLAERLRGDGVSPVSVSPVDVRKLESLQTEMARQQIPIEKAARQSLEDRLKASREPLGLFALANSFAGLLIVMGLIVVGLMGGPRCSQWVSVLLAATIAFCILLTKSNTALVGLFAGISWWALRLIAERWRRVDDPARKSLWLWIGICVLLGACVVGLAVRSGGLDQPVLSRAVKSLRYRLEYWQATWATIREHLWFGTGPGNFRDYYLAHKLPESSEEIADPHNFLLDVWANAGTFGLIGLLACVGLMVGQVFNLPGQKGNNARQVENLPHESAWTSAGVWGVGLAFPLGAIGMEFVGHGYDERLWWLGGIWWGLWLIVVVWSRTWNASSASNPEVIGSRLPIVLEGANVALLVHLLGAGGIAMPAITQLLWLVWAMRTACWASAVALEDEKTPSKSPRRGVMAGQVSAAACALAAGGLSLVCLWTAMMPELLCRTSLQAGDFEWGRRQIESAQARYLAAAEADPWAIEPWERLADLGLQRWQQSQLDADFDAAIRRLQVVSDRLPFASRPLRRLGQAWLSRFDRSHSPNHARIAAEFLVAAIERYPQHAALLSEWAISCEGAGSAENAREAARKSTQQDDINRMAGHTDKYLSTEIRRRMERLASRDSPAFDAN